MYWTIEWCDRDGVATHASGFSFRVSRAGWVMVQDSDGWSDDALQRLIAELHEILADVAQKGDAVH